MNAAGGEGRQRRGPFVSFEGVEGSGKSTQIRLLAESLERSGRTVQLTREPGGTDLGRRLRELLLHPSGEPMSPMAEMLLYATDRAQHLTELVLPALDRGEVVLCDRYLDATLAYQGYGRRLGTERILEIHRAPPLDLRPDRTVLLDIDPDVGVSRAQRRNESRGVVASEGRYEAEHLDFHRRVRRGYLELAGEAPQRIRIVDAGGTLEEVELRVREAVRDLFERPETVG